MEKEITFIILTYNEERLIEDCLDSLEGIHSHIFVVDDFSSDNTVEILKRRGIKFTQHKFVNYSQQRNWAQENNLFDTPWVCHLDADERLTPELREWFIEEFPKEKNEFDAFLFPRRAVFMGRWIKYGAHYPNNYHARLYKKGMGKCEEKAYDQHFVTFGKEKIIYKKDFSNILTDSLEKFTASHNKWSSHEAQGIISQSDFGEVQEKFGGNPIQSRRWMKKNFYDRMPLFFRSFFYFFYRFFIRGGFRDGKEGLIFHVLQAFWFRFLIDAKVYEQKMNKRLK
ncbi:MAG: glycosyltransferase family 2 protein [Candidatus Cyclobacteriaceae bacterium M3_2C_046]